MTRVFNFSAGPAVLPEAVLRQAADEMLDWHGSGMSVMEMSHRGKEFIAIHAEAESLLRELMAIPANYKVLFMQGGAIGENAIVPMNLLRGKASADYIHTGEWSKKSIAEAKRYGKVNVAASAEASGFTCVPARDSWQPRCRCRLRAHLRQRDDRRRRIPLHARRRRRAAGRRHVEQHPVAAGRRCPIRPDLRRRAEEHRPGRPDDRHRPRRPDRPRAPVHAVGLRLPAAGRERLDAQHAADLRDLHRRAGVSLDQGARRPGGDGRAQPRQGGAALRLPRPERPLPQPGRARRSFADERSLQAQGRGARRRVPERARRRAAWCS